MFEIWIFGYAETVARHIPRFQFSKFGIWKNRFVSKKIIFFGDNNNLHVTPKLFKIFLENINYQFSPNLNYQSVNDPIEYEVCLLLRDKFTFSDTTQCDSIYCIQLFVDYFKGLYVPNALAPNGGIPGTDEFLPKGQSLKEYNLQIFDTWGNLVWQTSDITTKDGKPATAWKGTTLDNKPLQQGTYVWKIYAKFSDGSVWPGIDGKTTGPIYLIR